MIFLKKNISIFILILFGVLILFKFLKEENDNSKLIKYKITKGIITKIKHYGVHSPSGFYYSYKVNKNEYTGYSSGKIDENCLYKQVIIKYSISDNSISKIYNLDSIMMTE